MALEAAVAGAGVEVEAVEGGGADADFDLSGGGVGFGALAEGEDFGAAVGFDVYRLHGGGASFDKLRMNGGQALDDGGKFGMGWWRGWDGMGAGLGWDGGIRFTFRPLDGVLGSYYRFGRGFGGWSWIAPCLSYLFYCRGGFGGWQGGDGVGWGFTPTLTLPLRGRGFWLLLGDLRVVGVRVCCGGGV